MGLHSLGGLTAQAMSGQGSLWISLSVGQRSSGGLGLTLTQLPT